MIEKMKINDYKHIFLGVYIKKLIYVIIAVYMFILILSPLALRFLGKSIDNFGVDWDLVIRYAIVYSLLNIIIFIFNYLFSRLKKRTIMEIEFVNRNDFIMSVLGKKWKVIKDIKHGQFMQLFFNQIEEMSSDSLQIIIKITEIIVTVIWVGFLAFSINWIISLVLFVIMPITAYFSLKSADACLLTSKEKQKRNNDYAGVLSEAIDNIKEIVLINKQRYFTDKHKNALKKSIDGEINHNKSVLKYKTAESLANLISLFIVAILGVVMISKGKMTGGELIVLFSYSSMLLIQLTQVNYIKDMWFGIGVIQENLSEIKNLEDEKSGSVVLSKNDKAEYVININNLYFKYNNRYIFRNFNLKVKHGEFIVIKGFSGAGKTTLFNLLLKNYQKESGEILIEGTKIEDLNNNSLRSYISYLSQKVFLFQGTAKENIIYGNESLSDDEIEVACISAGLPLDILKRNKIGELGKQLSGGERQRLALARALLKDASILLVDEPTSQLDKQNEKLIIKSLNELKGSMTILLVTHREYAEEIADRVICLGE